MGDGIVIGFVDQYRYPYDQWELRLGRQLHISSDDGRYYRILTVTRYLIERRQFMLSRHPLLYLVFLPILISIEEYAEYRRNDTAW